MAVNGHHPCLQRLSNPNPRQPSALWTVSQELPEACEVVSWAVTCCWTYSGFFCKECVGTVCVTQERSLTDRQQSPHTHLKDGGIALFTGTALNRMATC